jgi:hypothetical protein
MLDEQQAEINELKAKIGGNLEVLTEWQTASLVICGVFSPIMASLMNSLANHQLSSIWVLRMESCGTA